MNSVALSTRAITAIVIAAAFEGLRAGAGTFRALLDLPARTRIGPVAFAEFSRATDLSPAGVVFYIVFGFGGALVTGAAWLLAVREKGPRRICRLLAASAIASLLVLALTTQAAPLMWRVGSAPPDPVLLRELLDRFTSWTLLRIVCVDVSFGAVLVALASVALLRDRAQ